MDKTDKRNVSWFVAALLSLPVLMAVLALGVDQ